MNERLLGLAAEIDAIPVPRGNSPAALGRQVNVLAIKVMAELLMEALASATDDAKKREALSSFLYLAPAVEDVFGKGHRYVKVWRAMHAIAEAELEGKAAPTDEELGLTSKCFIATACYGSPDGVGIRRLRRFRDRVLLRSPLGRLLVSFYCRVSPPLAAWLRRSPRCRGFVRTYVIEPIAARLPD